MTNETSDLPTCWYCPKCKTNLNLYDIAEQSVFTCRCDRPDTIGWVEIPAIPPGTPLTVILDALGIEYRGSTVAVYPDGDIGRFPSHKPVLVVDNLKIDEESRR